MDSRTVAIKNKADVLKRSLRDINSECLQFERQMKALKSRHELDIASIALETENAIESLINKIKDEYNEEKLVINHFKDTANSVCIDVLVKQNETSILAESERVKEAFHLDAKIEFELKEEDYNDELDAKIYEALAQDEERHQAKLAGILEAHRNRMIELEKQLE